MSTHEHEIRRKLSALYQAPEWAFFGTVGNATGADHRGWADAVAVNLWPSSRRAGDQQVMFEIKVSRADFLRETKSARKAYEVGQYCTQIYLVHDSSIGRVLSHSSEVEDYDATKGWGVIDVAKIGVRGQEPIERPAASRKAEPLSDGFLLSLIRAMHQAPVEHEQTDPYLRNVVEIDRVHATLGPCGHKIAARLAERLSGKRGTRKVQGIHCYECDPATSARRGAA
jgi:hypothetical protein